MWHVWHQVNSLSSIMPQSMLTCIGFHLITALYLFEGVTYGLNILSGIAPCLNSSAPANQTRQQGSQKHSTKARFVSDPERITQFASVLKHVHKRHHTTAVLSLSAFQFRKLPGGLGSMNFSPKGEASDMVHPT